MKNQWTEILLVACSFTYGDMNEPRKKGQTIQTTSMDSKVGDIR